jgi:ketosteroid isomerase-like protein
MADPIDDELMAILESKSRALVERNRPFLTQLIHEDFVYVSVSGARADKAAYIDGVCGRDGLRFIGQRASNIGISRHGDCAVLIADVDDVFEYAEQRFEKRLKTMLTMVRSEGVWQWLAGQTMQPPIG